MTGPLILIVFVAGGDADDPTVRAMLRTTRDAVAVGTQATVRDMRDAPSDAGVGAVEEASHADAVVELSWTDGARREALLRVHVTAGPWVERSVRFAAEDADAERGRTLGFALASILPEREDAPQPPRPAPLPVSPPRDDATAFAPPATAAGQDVRLGVNALAAVGMAGLSASFGAEAAADWRAFGSLGFRASAGFIGGGASDVSTTTLRFTAGLTWHPLPASASRRWDLSVGADGVLESLSVTYAAPDSTTSTRARWLPGVGIGLDARWRFAPHLEGLAGFGVDDVFSPTYVVVRGVHEVTFPAVRGVGRLGLAVGL